MHSKQNLSFRKNPMFFILCLNSLNFIVGLAYKNLLPSLTIGLLQIIIYILLQSFRSRRIKNQNQTFNISFIRTRSERNGSITLNKALEESLKITIGNSQCKLPFQTGVFDIAFPLTNANANAISDFTSSNYKQPDNLYESSIRFYEFFDGGLLLQLEPAGMSSTNPEQKSFDAKEFSTQARKSETKLIVLNLTSNKQMEGIMVSDYCSTIKSENIGSQNSFLHRFSTFYDADGMISFLSTLRKLSGGKPIGLRTLIHDDSEFNKICFAIKKSEIYPDFIIVEGEDYENKPVQINKSSKKCLPMYEALQTSSKTLQHYRLNKHILIIGEQKITSGFDLLKAFAFGAQMVHSTVPNAINHSMHLRRNIFLKKDLRKFQEHIIHELARIMQAFKFENIKDITCARFMRSLICFNEHFGVLNDEFKSTYEQIYNKYKSNDHLQLGEREAKKMDILKINTSNNEK
ncbi:MAG: glutamate synthase-related protein [Flavisolibacter sp.]